MKEIKFRGKSEETNEWVYGQLLYLDNQPFIVGELVEANSEYTNLEWWQPVYPNSVGQFTGLHDKNGEEIYEGDIIEYTFDNEDSLFISEESKRIGLKKRIDKVYWQEWRSSFAVGCELVNTDLFRYVRGGNRVTIIGNIYENPELIKEESK